MTMGPVETKVLDWALHSMFARIAPNIMVVNYWLDFSNGLHLPLQERAPGWICEHLVPFAGTVYDVPSFIVVEAAVEPPATWPRWPIEQPAPAPAR